MRRPEKRVLIVFVTVPSRSEAVRIGKHLVKNGIAACVNVIQGVTSIYRWKGKVTEGRECLLILKTSRARYSALERSVKKLHSYEVPEIIGIEVKIGDPLYLGWVLAETLNM